MIIKDSTELQGQLDKNEGVGFLLEMEPKLYRAWPAISQSELKVLADKSPLHLMHQRKFPKPVTDPMKLGTAAHVAILEPLSFDQRYAKGPKVNLKTKVGKAEWADAEALASAKGRTLLKPQEFIKAIQMRDAVRSNPQASALLMGGLTERASFGSLYGAPVKILTDYYKPRDHAIVDLKTTKSAAPWLFEKDVRKLRYHWQACFYSDLIEQITGKAPSFHILAVESYAPYASCVYTFGFDLLAIARREIKEYIEFLQQCQERDEWPGYSSRIYELKSKRWEWEQHMERIACPANLVGAA